MRSALRHIILLALLAATLPAAEALAQVDTTARPLDTTRTVSSEPPRGSAGAPDSLRGSVQTPAAGTYVMTRDPMTATLLSIIPGGGQIYTRQYLKAVVFIGVAGFFAGQAIFYHGRFVDWASQYDALPATSGLRARYKANREANRDNRDRSIAYYAGVTILGMIDAYVGAHLFDFDVDGTPGRDADNAKIYVDPVEQRMGVWLRF